MLNLPLEEIYKWMMIFVRAGGLFTLIPVFSGQTIPVQIRVAVACMMALAVVPGVEIPEGIPVDATGLVIVLAREFLIGLIMGFVARMIFFAVEIAGQVIATEIGMMMSAQVDPITRNNASPVSLMLFYFSSLVFLLSGSHHAVILAFQRSFELVPIGQIAFVNDVVGPFLRQTGNIFLVAAQMSAPLMATNFVVCFTFAVLGKAAPSINVFSESFAVRILAGLVVLGLVIGLTAQLVLSWIRQSPELMLQLLP